MGKILDELGNAYKETLDVVKNAGKETIRSESAGDAIGNLLIAQPATIGLNMLGISMKTSLKISALLGWNMVKGGAKLLASVPLLPMSGKNGSDMISLNELGPKRIAETLKPRISQTRDQLKASLTQAA